MNAGQLSKAIREKAQTLLDTDPDPDRAQYCKNCELAELLNTLARLVEGQSLYYAFGAPGDWGYGTPIGDALAARP